MVAARGPLLAVLVAVAAVGAAGGSPSGPTLAATESFSASAQMSFENFAAQFPGSPLAADARFIAGEVFFQFALSMLKAEATVKKDSLFLTPKNPAAATALENARKAFLEVAADKKSGLAPSALYRLGEVSYDEKNWDRAIEDFRQVEKRYPKSYIVPEALLGIIYANLAQEQFSQAEANLFLLGEDFPVFVREPSVLYAKGIVSLRKGDYSAAEADFKAVKTAEAQYYLGKTYLLSNRAYLAAAAFETLARDYPDSELAEEARFFTGDCFFLAADYSGAIAKYQLFLSLYPQSGLRVSATFRIGSSYFQKKQFVEARANFQTVVDRYPKDYFTPLAEYFIAESYLAAGQMRDAMFAYTKVITQYPEQLKISPLAHYKLAWTGFQVGDYAQAVQTCDNFLALYRANAMAKNVLLIKGNALAKLGRMPEATQAFQQIVDIAPASEVAEQALFTILQTLYNQKAYNSILTSYQYIFRKLPPSKSKWRSLGYLYAAEAYLALSRTEEAKAIYQMILKVYPDDPVALYAEDGLAWAYAYEGQDERALEERRKLKEMLEVAPSTFPFAAQVALRTADSYYNQKAYDDAFQLYTQFAERNPKAPQAPTALYRAGMSLYYQRFYTQAVETWRRLMAQYPQAKEATQAAYQAADTLFRAQKYGEAVAAYRGIITAYPDNEHLPMANLRIAQAAFNTHRDDDAVRQIKELLTKYPKAAEASDALDLLEGVFDRSPAIDYKAVLRGLVAADPACPAAGEEQFRLARRCFEAKDFAGAAAGFEKFSVDYTNNPQLAKAQFYLGESYFGLNDYERAVPAYERFIKNFDKSADTPLALFHLAGADYALKRYDDAIQSYTRLMEEYPKLDYAKETQFNLALAYKVVGKTDLAQYAYQKYIELVGVVDPNAQPALWEIFSLQKERRDYEGALATLQRIRDRAQPGSDTPLEATYRMAEVYQAMNRPEDAAGAWTKLQAMQPRNNAFRLDALRQLGEAYEKAQDLDRAAAVYDDLARNAAKEVARSASARAAALRQSRGGKGRTPAAATAADSDKEPAAGAAQPAGAGDE